MAKDTFLNRKQTLNCKGKVVDISKPSVMAILNLTPDSFYPNSRTKSVDDALSKVEHFVKAGAKFIDLGAYSSRPGAAEVSEKEELERMVPAIKAINESNELSVEVAETYYDERVKETKDLMFDKNHDYGEAWRDMRISSLTDLILMKILRVKQIEDNDGQTLASEGIKANYQDMLNYAVFALIKLGIA